MPTIMCIRQDCAHRERFGNCDSASAMVTLLHNEWKCNRYMGKNDARKPDELKPQGEQLSLPGGL